MYCTLASLTLAESLGSWWATIFLNVKFGWPTFSTSKNIYKGACLQRRTWHQYPYCWVPSQGPCQCIMAFLLAPEQALMVLQLDISHTTLRLRWAPTTTTYGICITLGYPKDLYNATYSLPLLEHSTQPCSFITSLLSSLLLWCFGSSLGLGSLPLFLFLTLIF